MPLWAVLGGLEKGWLPHLLTLLALHCQVCLPKPALKRTLETLPPTSLQPSAIQQPLSNTVRCTRVGQVKEPAIGPKASVIWPDDAFPLEGLAGVV